jgi:hypothetical protein
LFKSRLAWTMFKILLIYFFFARLNCNAAAAASDKYCESKFCILDSDRMIRGATSDLKVMPCDDFKEFSIGNFYRFKALHDRYDRIGFLYDTIASYHERLRKLLNKKIEADESFVTKIAKNFFQKCIDSGMTNICKMIFLHVTGACCHFRLHSFSRQATSGGILEK